MKTENRALTIQIRYEPAPVIPLKQEGSLLEWLDANNRIIYREDKTQILVPVEDEAFDLIDDVVDADYDDDSSDDDMDDDMDISGNDEIDLE